MEARQHARAERASQQILRQLKKAFTTALRDLPPSEYLFFDLPKAQDSAEANGGGDQSNGEALPLHVKSPPHEELPASETESSQPEFLPFEPGPLQTVIIRPKHPRGHPGEERVLTAAALDEHGQPASGQTVFHWQMIDGTGLVVGAAEKCRVSSPTAGIVLVEVEAVQGSTTVRAQTTVKFISGNSESDADSSKGLPSYRISAEHGKPWRSRYDDRKNEIVINSAHRDFAASRATLAKHRRYIGKLYAKEVVLINFPHESAAAVMERLIELTLRTEENL
jgi:hypothetical protein